MTYQHGGNACDRRKVRRTTRRAAWIVAVWSVPIREDGALGVCMIRAR